MNKGKLHILGNIYDIFFLNYPRLEVTTADGSTTAKWKPFLFGCVESQKEIFSCGGCVLETEEGNFLMKDVGISENVMYFNNCYKDE